MTPRLLQYRPDSVGETADLILDELRQSGAAVLNVNDEPPEVVLPALQGWLGGLVNHKHSGLAGFGSLVSIRAHSGAYDDSPRPQNTPTIQSPHTDGCYMTDPPSIVALHCVARAHRGGESVIVDARDVISQLFEQVEWRAIAPLFAAEAYEISRGDRTLTRPVFVLKRTGVTWCVGTYFSAHEFNRVKIHPEAARAFDLIRGIVTDSRNQTVVALEPGHCLFVANANVLHGRLAWRDSDTNVRHVLRAWFASTEVSVPQSLSGWTGAVFGSALREQIERCGRLFP
jgi:alpha-ketoglutarate-dependent taurine dioxygenase